MTPPSPPCVLLLEDDPAIARTVAYALERDGFAVRHVLLVREAAEQLRSGAADVALLDVGLPDGSGLDLCRTLRQEQPALPIVLLTARSDETDRVLGLELGADDYVAKPFSPRELVARVRALLRRARATASPVAPPHGLFELDEAGSRVRYAGQPLSLTRRELGLLRVLLRSPGRIHSRESLLDAVWGADADSGDRTVDTHVKTLRAKLREVKPELDPIVTHRGLGYSLELPAS
ncbi:two-component system response regulator CreB [Methylibium rhizosphaerae]|uniref:two-component system response regulator CreB n=1 Tax=Methylibium rhizosphaerae TaxID=2570323 RepID=UPI00112E4D32|nr:two-component system response regulator CreB [Methylibium rhizosphaerae]